MTNDELCNLSATALAPLIRDGAVRAVELVDAVLARIDRLDPVLNAFALVDGDGARRAAVAADEARDKGEALGSLHGVPFSVKDLILTKGMETAFGSHLMAGNIPTRSAAAVERMERAGAILLGKTTTPEFAHSALTDSPRYGPTRNPWNPDYSCGGSSGGAAVAAASGMGPLTVTTDGAGSSRIPASCCGVLGLKATLGRIPNENGFDLFGNFSYVGAITRTTADLVAMLNVMSGPLGGDPWTLGAPHAPCEIPANPELTLRGLRVHYKPRLGNELLDDGVAAAMEKTLETLARAGVIVTRSDGREDWGNELARVSIRATLVSRMAHFSAADREKMTPSLRAAIAESEALDPNALRDAPMQRTALFHQAEAIFTDSNLLLTPSLGAPPPRIGHTALDPITINGEVAGSLRANWYNYPAPFNLTGHPAISIPVGHTPDGLPVGLQAVAPWHGEQKLIDLAAALEAISPWGAPPIATDLKEDA
ncbi:MAG: aspartyl-tRNA(Asn)/glutamyl-tRNA(Gln) amidotransferase subunit A [Alphaproteobacteria bacterium]|jgi:aspartyl-tRNA(Asn)/glutamyl-tRNA(Gln) amidotransferase subunit A